MKIYRLTRTQTLRLSIEEAWDFFAAPQNLQQITPPDLDFKIMTADEGPMYAGMMITYRIKPMFAIPITWVTEITHAEAPHYFVDEQRFGPYRFWHHQHKFRATTSGVEMDDIVHYALPMGWLGRVAHAMVIKKQLETIFDHRFHKLERMCGAVRS